jgi:putative Holliday junction resolvase
VRAILAVADEYEVEAFVVGLPVNMDDTEGPQAKRTRAFGAKLARASGKAVHYCDERLSSIGADDQLAEAQLSHRKHKARRDAVAAQIILQAFLASRGGESNC